MNFRTPCVRHCLDLRWIVSLAPESSVTGRPVYSEIPKESGDSPIGSTSSRHGPQNRCPVKWAIGPIRLIGPAVRNSNQERARCPRSQGNARKARAVALRGETESLSKPLRGGRRASGCQTGRRVGRFRNRAFNDGSAWVRSFGDAGAERSHDLGLVGRTSEVVCLGRVVFEVVELFPAVAVADVVPAVRHEREHRTTADGGSTAVGVGFRRELDFGRSESAKNPPGPDRPTMRRPANAPGTATRSPGRGGRRLWPGGRAN